MDLIDFDGFWVASYGIAGARVVDGIFEEAYCAAFFIFDKHWQSMGAKYMDFPKVKEAAKVEIDGLLESIVSLEELKRLNAKNFDADTDLIKF